MTWVKQKIHAHWKAFGKAKTFVHRDHSRNRIIIDYCNGGRCAIYTYEGKWIAG